MDVDDDDDETMQLALQLSMQQDGAAAAAAPAEPAAPSFHDPTFVNQMLSQLPGVDPNDPAIQAALAKIRGDEKKDDEKKDD
jgi:26S proteasome regulatory subunit N10